jgi:hypothetical protein
MDFFGREFAPVEDKLYAIGPYKYHIAIENCSLENYWTEKLTDAWIAWSLPIYCGDPTIIDQVPDPLGIEVINAADTESSVRRIESILNEDIYESRYEAIKKCREWAIAESNPYEKVCRIIESSDGKTRHAPPESADYLVCGKASVRTTVIFDLIADTFGKNCSKNLFNGYKHLQRRLKK